MGPIIVAGESPLDDGPDGFLNKFRERRAELEEAGFACEGVMTDRCPWPMGIYSQSKPLCRKGYFFSYQQNKCYQEQPAQAKCSKGKKNGTVMEDKFDALSLIQTDSVTKKHHVCLMPEHEEQTCGKSYDTICALDGNGKCSYTCVTKKFEEDVEFPHVVCTTDGVWLDHNYIDTSYLAQVTFASTDQFKCPFELY